VDDVDHWTAGLEWYGPFSFDDSGHLDPAMVAIDIQAQAVNEAVIAVERAAGTAFHDPATSRFLGDRALDRFCVEPHLGCEHSECTAYTSLWGGGILAMTCDRPLCLFKLDHVIEASRRLRWCGMCDFRHLWLEEDMIIAVQAITGGRLLVPVHGGCIHPDPLPDWP
jgi:hypothetical protein